MLNRVYFKSLSERTLQRLLRSTSNRKAAFYSENQLVKLHFGPGPVWKKPGNEWLAVDVDSKRGDIVLNFNSGFKKLPLKDNSVECIYGSHIFEHISIYVCPLLFEECYRVLAPGGYFRLVLPDVRKSIEQYLNNNIEFPLFTRRAERAKEKYGIKYTIFECLKEDFLSRSGQSRLLGKYGLAHQNAWDFEAISSDLFRAGFESENISLMSFQKTNCEDFSFEGTYESEANEYYRSLYVEVSK